MTRVLPVILPILGLAIIIALVNLFSDRFSQDSGDPYDWQ